MNHLIVALLAMVVPTVAIHTGTLTSLKTTDPAIWLEATTKMNLKSTVKNVKSHSSSIIGGLPASVGEFPWFGRTEILFLDPFTFNSFTISCGASLIHRDVAVSAAHCIVDAIKENPLYLFEIKFNLGAIRYDGIDGTSINVELVTWYDEYTGINSGYDIVFYTLSTSTNSLPVSRNSDPMVPVVGDIATAIGFGLTSDDGIASSRLLKVDLSIIDDVQCLELYNIPFTQNIVCTNAPGEGKDICQGDSGGPLITQDGILFGITSFSNEECTQGPAGFTRISSFDIPKVICDLSDRPPRSCGCGLFGLGFFCPFTLNGFFGRILKSIF